MNKSLTLLHVLLLAAAALPFPKATSAQASADSLPISMAQCEPDSCATWAFHGKQGSGQWTTGPIADLTIEHFDASTVSIHREDRTGPGKGIDGHYVGTRKGDHIEGTFVWVWPGGKYPTGTVNWIATIQWKKNESERPVPGSMAMCEGAADGCSTWSFEGKKGHGQWPNGASAKLSVEHFDEDRISIRRADADGAWRGLVALYTGTIKEGRIEGTMTWLWPDHGQFTIGTVDWHATIQNALSGPAATPASSISLGSIVDVPVKEKMFGPPPTPAWHGQTDSIAAFDLSGTWELDQGASQHRVEKISIYQLRDIVLIHNLEGREYFPAGAQILVGKYSAPTSIHSVTRFVDEGGQFQSKDATVIIKGPDHIHAGESDYHRTSRNPVRDVACDPHNAPHISGEDASSRGDAYFRLNDIAAANCWYYVGAIQGDAYAQGSYAFALFVGRGVAADPAQAFSWMQKSAMQGFARSEFNLAKMFADGLGTPSSAQRHAYWLHRAEIKSPDFVHDGQHHPIPAWTLEISEPCDRANPSHADANEALVKGRVAYQARALAIAACWFHISADKGNTKANVYLGVLYAYGWGVARNPPVGFAYMEKAAKARDPYGMVYLANFYRFGMGTAPDMNQASALIGAVNQTSEGQNAFMSIQGTQLSALQSLVKLGQLANVAGEEGTCNELRAMENRNPLEPSKRDCEKEEGEGLAGVFKPEKDIHHTLDTPEEIYPERLPYAYP